ncbi:hypothetical protein [Bosea robiniae]|uniref:Uncharacterized protein n=1 Tax=Bosea robiniae TaxID=1036780 RepID=A0ABY0PA38_9HYPH|nr:hypothetical protein [Bosea robiniae]SDH80818.1 hypothetical protein SAMN05421844_11714 [Bosea robiniae]
MKTVLDGDGDHEFQPDVATSSASQLIGRLRRVLRPEDLDCACRETLSGALARFDEQERRRETRRRLAAAREHKERIASILHFLSELDALSEAENDRTVFEEFALLFVEIERSGEAAVSALRGL